MRSDTRFFPFFVLSAFLFLTGGFLRTLSGESAYLPNLFFLAGAAVFLLTAIRAADSVRRSLVRVREVAEPGPASVWLLLGAILLVVSGILAIQTVRFDLTHRKIHELSRTSREALEDLEEEIVIVAAFRDNDPIRPRVDALLTAYRQASRRIETLRVDPEREPDKAREHEIRRLGTIVVRAGGVEETVEAVQEADVTQAILRLSDPDRPIVAFTTDHGEMAPERPPWNKLRARLRDRGFVLRLLSSSELVSIPPDVRVLVVAGPTSAFLPGEVEAVSRFLGRGGRLAAFLDPRVPTGLEPLLEEQGIWIDGRLLADDSRLTRALQMGGDALAVGVEGLGDHEVTRRLPAGVVLKSAQQVGLGSRAIFGTNGTDLLRSEPGAHPLGPEGAAAEEPARRPLAAALEWEVAAGPIDRGADPTPEKPYARVVVVGDSDFLRDDMIDLFGNPEFVSRIFGWLGEREYLLQFPSFGPAGTPLEVGRNGLMAAFYVVQIALPLLAFALGFFLWARRR